MGTSANTFVYTADNDEAIMCLYRHFDGSPEEHGMALLKFLNSLRVVNGLGINDTNVANGMECLAAQMVVNFKTEAGGFYLMPPEREMYNNDVDWQYHIFNGGNTVMVKKFGEVVFKGTKEEFGIFCQDYDA